MDRHELRLGEGESAIILFESEIEKDLAEFCNEKEITDRVIVYEIKNENLETIAFEVHTPYTNTRDNDKFQALCLALSFLSSAAVNLEKNFIK